MATVYILYSQKIDKFYVGSCLDLAKRLFDHNNGTYSGSFTAKTNDWEIFFHVDELNEITARNIEVDLLQKVRRQVEHYKTKSCLTCPFFEQSTRNKASRFIER